jgi:hypothetical protein
MAAEASTHALLADLLPATPRTDLWPLIRAATRGRQPMLARLRVYLGAPRRALAAGAAVAAVAVALIIGPSYLRPHVTITEAKAVAGVIQTAQPNGAYDDPMGDNTDRILAAIEEGT